MAYFNGKSYRNELHHRLEEALVEEAKRRHEQSCAKWITSERQMMLDIVNDERTIWTPQDRVEKTCHQHRLE